MKRKSKMNLSLEKLNITKLTGLHTVRGGGGYSSALCSSHVCTDESDVSIRTRTRTNTQTGGQGPSENGGNGAM